MSTNSNNESSFPSEITDEEFSSNNDDIIQDSNKYRVSSGMFTKYPNNKKPLPEPSSLNSINEQSTSTNKDFSQKHEQINDEIYGDTNTEKKIDHVPLYEYKKGIGPPPPFPIQSSVEMSEISNKQHVPFSKISNKSLKKNKPYNGLGKRKTNDQKKKIKDTDKSIKKIFEENDMQRDEWATGIEILLIEISQKSMGYRWMHNMQKSNLEKKDSLYKWVLRIIIAIQIGVTGSTFGTLITIAGLGDNRIALMIVMLLILILQFLYTVFSEAYMYKRFPDKISENDRVSDKFNEIHLNIQGQIALPRHKRVNDTFFLAQTLETYNTVLNAAPTINSSIIKKYINARDNDDITLPINIPDDTNIKIVVDKKTSELTIQSCIENDDVPKQSIKSNDKVKVPKSGYYDNVIKRYLRNL